MSTTAGDAAPPSRVRSVSVTSETFTAGDVLGGRAKFACETCKHRKLKCTRELPSCTFCAGRNQHCLYLKAVRTPLTRKNLDAAEEQIAHLESLLRRRSAAQSLPHTIAPPESSIIAHSPPQPALPTLYPAPPPAASSASTNLTSAPPPAGGTSSSPAPGSPRLTPVPARFDSPVLTFPDNLNAPQQATASQASPFFGASMFSAASPMSMAPPPAATRPPFDHLSTSMSVSSTSTFVPNQVGVPETPNEVTAEPDGDGTGSFKEQVGPNSGAYLGSLSSAALLQHLQKCAADVNLSNPRGHVNAASPSSTITSSVALLPEHMERYLSAYFNVFHLQYPMVHEASFRAQLADIVPRPDGESWELLHLVILGLGSLCVIGDSDLNETLMLYDKATNRIGKAQFESASLTSVQAFVLLGNFAQKVNHTSAGSVFLSIGLRMAINLGLHSEGAAQNESCFDQEQRRRVWWTLFVFESGAQITFGHPSVLPNAGVDVLPIVAVPDTSFTPAALFRPLSVDGPTAYSSLLYQTFFHQLANTFIPHFTLSQHSLTTAEVLRFYRDIDRFQASLPFYFLHPTAPFFNFTQHKLVWRLENLRMVVLRQTFLKVTLAQGPSTPDDESCFEQAVSCATRVIQSVQRFTESGPKSAMEWWYSLHFLLPAIFITLIALRAHTSSPGALDHLVTLQSARSVLSNATHPLLHPLASRCLSIISAVANLDSDNAGNARGDVLMGQMGDQDFTSFLEMFSGTAEMEGPMQSFGSDLDALFHFVTPAGSPGGSGHI